MRALDQKPKHGEIWLMNCEPSVGHEYRGIRPALVVQAVELDNSRLITVVPLSTKIDKGNLCDIVILKDTMNRLQSDSLAKIQHIQSRDRSRFDFYIGKVSDESLRQVKESLRVHLGLKNNDD